MQIAISCWQIEAYWQCGARHETCVPRDMKGIAERKLNHFCDVLAFFALVLLTCAANAQPELKVIPQQGPAHPGLAYRIVCEVSWAGKASDYSILPAEADPIDWGTAALTEVKGVVRDEADGPRNIVSQTLEITPNKAGEFKTPAIRIAYFNPEATPPAESAAPSAVTPGTAPPVSSASPSLGAEPFSLVVYPDRTPIWISGGLGASLLLTALGWWSVRRLHSSRPLLVGSRVSGFGFRVSEEPKPDTPNPVFEEALRCARRHRQEGDFYQFYVELARAAGTLAADNGHAPELTATLKTRAQETGYKGVRPRDDQMDGDLRDLERAIARQKETLET